MSAKSDDPLFKTTDILSIFIACTFVIALCFKVGWNLYTPVFSETIKAEAIISAYQLWELENKNSKKVSIPYPIKIGADRKIASIEGFERKQGIISMDPWNSPYHYLIKIEDSHIRQIVVWSRGPDGKNNSSETAPIFSGDDTGESLIINL